MKAIEITNLKKYYGKSMGIEDVSLEVDQGEIFGFIGPNGAGKSTTIRTLLGLIHPSGGTASVLGHDIKKESLAIKKKIGYVPAEVHYYSNMSSRELLEHNAKYYSGSDPKRIEELATYFELNLDKPIDDLSFGNKKKCAIIQALAHNPELLILDEPTTGLDPLMKHKLFDLLSQMNAKGMTIFFSSHILAEVQQMCHRATIIRKGVVVATENIHTLLEKQTKKVRLLFAEALPNLELPSGGKDAKWNKNQLTFEYLGDINTLLSWASKHQLLDAVFEEPDLETIFMNYYEH